MPLDQTFLAMLVISRLDFPLFLGVNGQTTEWTPLSQGLCGHNELFAVWLLNSYLSHCHDFVSHTPFRSTKNFVLTTNSYPYSRSSLNGHSASSPILCLEVFHSRLDISQELTIVRAGLLCFLESDTKQDTRSSDVKNEVQFIVRQDAKEELLPHFRSFIFLLISFSVVSKCTFPYVFYVIVVVVSRRLFCLIFSSCSGYHLKCSSCLEFLSYGYDEILVSMSHTLDRKKDSPETTVSLSSWETM